MQKKGACGVRTGLKQKKAILAQDLYTQATSGGCPLSASLAVDASVFCEIWRRSTLKCCRQVDDCVRVDTVVFNIFVLGWKGSSLTRLLQVQHTLISILYCSPRCWRHVRANMACSLEVAGILQRSTSPSLFSPGAREACDEAASTAGTSSGGKIAVQWGAARIQR